MTTHFRPNTRDQLEMESPIMIGGCGSSGTTLVSHLLNAHPSIHCGPELYLLNKKTLYTSPFRYSKKDFLDLLDHGIPSMGVLNRKTLPFNVCTSGKRNLRFLRGFDKYGYSRTSLSALAHESKDFKQFIDIFFARTLKTHNKIRWAEKTPTNCFCIEHFLSLYPLGKYVHVIRDGRDVIFSLMARGMSTETAVRRWLYDTITGLPFKNHNRYHEIKYEDLVTDTNNVLENLLTFLELEGTPKSLINAAMRSSPLETTHSSWNAQPNEPITTASIGKWKNQSRQLLNYFEQLFQYTFISDEVSKLLGLKKRYNANSLLIELGYDTSKDWNDQASMGWKLLSQYLLERFFCSFFKKQLYCYFSKNSI